MADGRRSTVITKPDNVAWRASVVQINENELPVPVRRLSRSGMSDTGSSNYSFRKSVVQRPVIEQVNTYRLEPEKPFPYCTAEKKMKDILESHLSNTKFESTACKSVCVKLSDLIKDCVKRECKGIDRFKLVCWVTIGQVAGQDVNVASRCIWNTDWDTCSSASFQNNHLFAVANLYAIYYE